MKKKFVYFFGPGNSEGNGTMKDVLGGKGANLAEMARIGLPVPPGFTITTEACVHYHNNKSKLPSGLKTQIKEHLSKLEKVEKKKFSDRNDPLLVSVRSGSKFSMPGMMDTVLNLGLNDDSVLGLAKKTGQDRFAWDCYRRFIQMFSDVVFSIDKEHFEELLEKKKKKKKVKLDTQLTAADLKSLVGEYKKVFEKHAGTDFPQEPAKQLEAAYMAVFDSWNNKRARTYRRLNKISDDLGTAVNVQAMVFGNMGETSGTGVAFTRNPSTGKKEYYGECLINAQGEDVVAGIRTPMKIEELKKPMPKAYKELLKVYDTLEKHYKDMQDFEFTIQEGKLYMLQTRTGKRTGAAAVKIAVDMVKEKLIDKNTALMRVEPHQLDQLLHRQIDPAAKLDVLAKGLPASPGAASGQIVFTADESEVWAKDGKKVILVRPETTPEDIHGMVAAAGILTSRGGMTSHAAVVARGMGEPCVAGCEQLKIDVKSKKMAVKGGRTFKEGDWITIDGSTGRVISGQVPTIEPKLDKDFEKLLGWADKVRRLQVWTNADAPKDAQKARDFGAQGIGLCRTEHMFFEEDRLPIVRRMIMANDDKIRAAEAEKLLPFQKKDFLGILNAMQGYPVTIRLLDPPLHEFLPDREELIVNITKMELQGASKKKITEQKELLAVVNGLSEFNPMLGHRGCRLGITFPVIYDMQVRAIIEAACELRKKKIDVRPEIMIPLIGHVNELKPLVKSARDIADKIIKKHKVKLHYLVGTMIEIPRAALTSADIAEYAEFFSFGTNDLTQMTFGYSRDDAEGKFLFHYVETGILPVNPFQTIDQEGVGRLMKVAVKEGRSARKDLIVGICGEHGGDPESVEFCHKIGLDYVSCSPFRVPIARLAAAQAMIKYGTEKSTFGTRNTTVAKKKKVAGRTRSRKSGAGK